VAAEFTVGFIDDEGSRRDESLEAAWDWRFERSRPVRKFPSRPGQRHFPGLWWSATTGEHVGFESWLEREHAMMLDFDPAVAGFSSQPFWLRWHDGGRARRHAPDYFARMRDGSGLVIDVRADDQVGPQDAAVFEVTARACASAGWAYRRSGVPDAVLTANLRWLAGYRHPRCRRGGLADLVLDAFARPAALLDGVRGAGDPLAVLPAAYHLLWTGELAADLAASLLAATTVVTAAGTRA
jgi:hypothetical protein